MGYSTRYNLTILEGGVEMINEFRRTNRNATYALDEEGSCNDDCKWYDHEKDLKDFSINHPNALFLLEGQGEESGDEWKLYVQNGHSQMCKGKMVFPEFDKGKLLADIRDSKLKLIGI